jgi:hypothetical protein
MRKLYLPLLFNKETTVAKDEHTLFLPGDGSWKGYYTLEDAREAAKKMAMSDPKGKVVILESAVVVEPRRIEFAEKTYNAAGELIV